jgi:site-specific recombinase XerD
MLSEVERQAMNDRVRCMLGQRTQKAYAADWRDFATWCAQRGFHALPATPETVALYLRARADEGLRRTTLRRRLAAISARHREARVPSPTSDALVRAASRDIDQLAQLAAKTRIPISPPELRRLLESLPPTRAGLRDHALISFAFASSLRRNELVLLDIDQIEHESGRLVIASKAGTPASAVELVKLTTEPLCPVTAYHRWVEVAQIHAGPLFRPVDRHSQVLDRRLSDRTVGLIVARAAERAGLEHGRISADSLRLGGQALAKLGISLDDLTQSA